MIVEDGYIYDKEDILREMGVSEYEYYSLRRKKKIDLGKRFTDSRGITRVFFTEEDMKEAFSIRKKYKKYSIKGISSIFKMTQKDVLKLIEVAELKQNATMGRVYKKGEKKKYSEYEVGKLKEEIVAEDGKPTIKESNEEVARLIEEAKIKKERKKERKKRRIETKGKKDDTTDMYKNVRKSRFDNLELGTEYMIYEATREANKYSFVKNAKLMSVYSNILLFDDGLFKECFLNNKYSLKLVEVK